MSSDGDIIAFQNSVNDNLTESNTVMFNDKNYTFITDSTSNSGSFSSGQIQFDLSTLSSQSQWVDLKEAFIEFPVKVTASILTAGTGAETTKSIAAAQTAIMKCGWHQWIDSSQLIINGQTIQSSQPYENVSAQFRILSTWSQDTLTKFGQTCGVALDDCTADTQNTVAVATGLQNVLYSTVAASVKGLDLVNNQGTVFNKGVAARSTYNNDISPANPSLQTSILGATAMKAAGRCHVASTAAGSNTAGTAIFSANYMATVRLKDLCDIKDFPMVKSLKGFLYLSFNSTQVNLTGTTGAATLASVATTPITGRCTPFLINNSSTGLLLGNYATTAPVVQIVGSVDATATAVGSAGPLLTNARLLVPYYKANPKADSALTMSNHFFSTLDKIVNPITITAGSTINYTITSGIANPRKLLLFPMLQSLGGASLTNPEISPFDPIPGCSSPFCELSNLQVYVSNQPQYQYPIQYTFEQWLSENSQLGLNGATINEQTSGLLTQQLFEQNHRFYYVDLSRRTESSDGSSKSVQVSFTNPTTFGMKVIAVVFAEKKWIINTGTCTLQSA